MSKYTDQMQEWAGQFGREYTDRNARLLEEEEQLSKQLIGSTRAELNTRFIGDIDRNVRILEVGCNIGNQLQLLQNMDFKNLYGIELQSYAVELSKNRTKNINIIQGSAFDIPFKDDFFDLVFTSGVLIHISPHDIPIALDEIYRCSKRYILGVEYYAETYTQVNYRGRNDLLWKTDFPKLYVDRFRGLQINKKELLKYSENDNVNVAFLLEKK